MFPLCLFAKGLALVTVRRSGVSWALGSASYLCNETSGFIGWTETGHTRERRKRRKALQVRKKRHRVRNLDQRRGDRSPNEMNMKRHKFQGLNTTFCHQGNIKNRTFASPIHCGWSEVTVNGQLWMNIPYARYRLFNLEEMSKSEFSEWRLWLASTCYVL